jgi:hypothetical protein
MTWTEKYGDWLLGSGVVLWFSSLAVSFGMALYLRIGSGYV